MVQLFHVEDIFSRQGNYGLVKINVTGEFYDFVVQLFRVADNFSRQGNIYFINSWNRIVGPLLTFLKRFPRSK